MANERLRSQLVSRGLTITDLAERLEVDPKTVERWITKGRVPHQRHRLAAAHILEVDQTYLWPSVADDPRTVAASEAEFLQLYPHRGMVPLPLWSSLIDKASEAVDVLVYAGLYLFDAHTDLASTLVRKADSGVKIRMLLGDEVSEAVAQRGRDEGIGDDLAARIRLARSAVAPLRDVPGIEVKKHATVLYNSLYRFDSDLLVNLHVYGAQAPQSPVIHLRRVPGGRLFDHYMGAFDRVWATSTSLWE